MSEAVLITGVSSGIGRAVAENCLKKGWEVFGMSRRRANLPDPNFKEVQCDLAKLDEIPQALEKLLGRNSQLNYVMLNAAILGDIKDLRESTVEDLQRVFDVNVWANKMVLDTLFRLGTEVQQVIGISSGAATTAFRGWGGYSISKAALNMLMGLYAAEIPQVHFVSLAPGLVDTPMQQQIAHTPPDPRFSSLEMLRSARGTPFMPSPEIAAEKIILSLPKLKRSPSGAFVDLTRL